MICNVCHVLIDGCDHGCDSCGENCCERCLSIQYSNFSYYDGGVDIDYICDRCKGCVILYRPDCYEFVLYQSLEHTFNMIPERGDSHARVGAYLLIRRLFWFRYPVRRELPQYSQSKNDAFLEKYGLDRVLFAERVCGVDVATLEKGMVVCY